MNGGKSLKNLLREQNYDEREGENERKEIAVVLMHREEGRELLYLLNTKFVCYLNVEYILFDQ